MSARVKHFLSANFDFYRFINFIESFNKFTGIAVFEENYFGKNLNNFVNLFRLSTIIISALELTETPNVQRNKNNYYFFVARAHYVTLIFICLITQIISYLNRKNYNKIHKYFKILKENSNSIIKGKRLILIIIFDIFCVVFGVLSVIIRTHARIFWRFENIWESILTWIYVVNSVYTLFVQHYLTILFCHYLEALRQHFQDINENLRNMIKPKFIIDKNLTIQ